MSSGAWLRGALASIGFGPTPPPPAPLPAPTDVGTQLAGRRTDMALDRTFLAAERTLMAWIRTALSMISFGFTIVKVLEAFQQSQGQRVTGLMGRSISPQSLGLALIGIGTLSLVIAVLQHRVTLRRLRQRGLEPQWSLALLVAGLISILGVFAFGGIVLGF